MTIDDNSSIYVGNIPYDSTEATLRNVFHIYGAVVAVKMFINYIPGKNCYAFVTFSNPESAIHAINGMNGKLIGGREVNVNGVKSPKNRGGISHFGCEKIHRDSERDIDSNRNRGRDRDRDSDWERVPLDQDIVRGHVHDGRQKNKNHDMERETVHDLDFDRGGDVGTEDHDRKYKDTDQLPKSQSGSSLIGRRIRKLPLSSGDNYDDEEEQEGVIRRHRVLEKEVSLLEESLEEKNQLVSNLKKKSQKLEDALTSTKKLTSQRQQHLSMVQRGFLQVKYCTEKLKSAEQELESLVDTLMIEADGNDGANDRMPYNKTARHRF